MRIAAVGIVGWKGIPPIRQEELDPLPTKGTSMRFPRIRVAANSVKILAAGALLAAGAAGCALPNANAATVWTAVTQPEAGFLCVSNCSAGGVGPVPEWVWVGVDGSTYDMASAPIGAWPRTVAIQCKELQLYSTAGKTYYVTEYQVEVRDKNWAGLWSVQEDWIAQDIDDTSIPSCQ